MKKILINLIILLFIIPAVAQETKDKKDAKDTKEVKENKETKEPVKKGGEVEKTRQTIYTEVVLEDFENSQYTNANLKINVTKDQQGSIQIRDQYPAETNNSKKYLGVKVYAKSGDVIRIDPPKPFEITRYCKSISVWVYGKNFSGELSLMLQDYEGKVHRLVIGKIAFLGWKKLTVNLDKSVKQQDEYLEKDKSIKVLYFQYRPGNDSLLPQWQYFYIDDITATVRDKFKDRQNDEW